MGPCIQGQGHVREQDAPERCLFLKPRGPWQRVGTFPGPFIGALVPKGSGSNTVWFTAAGSAAYPYTLNVVKLTVQTSQ